MEKLLGSPAAHQWSSFQIGAAYTLTLFILSDLSRYIVHRCFHEISALWQFHQVHHSATDLTPMTLYRLHPIEIVILEVRRSLVIGLTSGFFLYWFRGDLNSFDMLGIKIFGFLFNLTGANLRHSQTWLSYGRFIERIFISPAQHQIHHSSAAIHSNKNYGSCLAIWDRLGKSLVLARKPEKLTYGISGEPNEVHPTTASALLSPFKKLFRLTVPANNKLSTNK
jgi:sterol desaturase/sphingolipid hydroxylase (fatty acid hydroxylase superfamily)